MKISTFLTHISLLLTLLLITATACAGENSTATLEVSIVAESGNAPIPGAKVNLYRKPSSGKRQLVKSFRTDPGGKFSLSLKPGNYKYTVIAKGYAIAWDSFRLKQGEALQRKLSLQQEAVVTGRFLAPDDTPLADIDVLITKGMLTTTNKSGSFTVRGIRTGGQKLLLLSPEWQAEEEPTVRLAPGKKVDIGTIRLARTTTRGGVNRPVTPGLSRSIKKTLAVKDGAAETVIIFPKEALDEGGELSLLLSPTLEKSLNVALSELAEAPFDSLEQTISRFLPAIQIQRILGSKHFSLDKELAEKLPEITAAGLTRIYSAQHADGGWGWWQGDASDPHLTAEVIGGLCKLSKSGIKIRDGVIPKGVKALEQMTATASPAVMPFIYRALAAAGSKNNHIEMVMEKEWRRLQPSEKLQYIAGLLDNGQTQLAQAFQNEAKKLIHLDVSSAYMRDDDAYSWWYSGRWGGSAVETTALFLSCQLALDPKDPLVPKLVEFLVRNRAVPGWNTNRGTATMVMALAEYLAISGNGAPSYEANLKLNNSELTAIKVEQGAITKGPAILSVPTSKLVHGENRLRLEKTGKDGVLYLNAILDYQVPKASATLAPGITFNRKAYKVVKQPGVAPKLTPLVPGEIVNKGDEIEMQLLVENVESLNHLIVEELLPKEFKIKEPQADPRLKGDLRFNGWYVHRERYAGRLNFFIKTLEPGKHEFRFVATVAGKTKFPDSTAAIWPVYMPLLRTESSFLP
jgi:hypothetical protein